MANSVLAAVHEAILGDAAELVPEGAEPGAPAPSKPEEKVMSKDNTPAGGDQKPGTSQAEHDAAVSAAAESGKAAGAQAELARLSAALGADGVKGDGVRMAAALDMAIKSPSMSGEDIAAFVTSHVAAGKPSEADPAAYEAQRVAAAGLAQPAPRGDGKKANLNTNAIYASRRKQNQEG